MPDATAKAQAADALEQAAQALKRNIGVSRRVLQIVRQAQVGLIGIEVETHSPNQEGIVDGSSNQEAA